MRGLSPIVALRGSEIRLLQQALADAASGTPRQWWHLEIAARYAAEPSARVWVRGLARVVARLGGVHLAPYLAWLGVPGLAPYHWQDGEVLGDEALRGARWAVCILGLLTGMGAINASRELALVLCALFVGGAAAFAAGRRTALRRRQLLFEQDELMARLTPSESALGLVGLLTATGLDFGRASELTEAWTGAPEAVMSSQLQALGLLAPAHAAVRHAAYRHGGILCLGVAAVAWPCWLTQAPWQFVPALLGCLLCHYVVSAWSPRGWRDALRSVAIGVLAVAVGRLLRLL